MPLRKVLFFVSLLVSTTCLAVGLGMAGQPLLALASFLPAALLLVAPKSSAGGMPGDSLFIAVGLAGLGLLLGAAPLPMILASTAALASWDLALLERALKESPPELTRRLERKHIASLALALGLGLLVAGLGRIPRLHLPFALSALLAGLAFFSLERVVVYLIKDEGRKMKAEEGTISPWGGGADHRYDEHQHG